MFCITEEKKKEEEEERKKKEKEEREKRRAKRPTLGIYQPPSLVRHRQQRDIGDDTENIQGTVRPNKKISVFQVTGLKILGREGMQFFFLEKLYNIKLYIFFQKT